MLDTDPAITDPADPHYRDPWPRFMRELGAMLDELPEERPPAGTFPEPNPMTPEVVAFVPGAGPKRGQWAEVSWGGGFAPGSFMIGITVARAGAEPYPQRADYDASHACHSIAEAGAWLRAFAGVSA